VLGAPAVSAQPFAYRTFLAGLGSTTGGNGVAVADYNGDGHPDLYVVSREAYDPARSVTWNRLYANRGDGTFTDRTVQAGVPGSAGLGLPNTAGNGAKLGAAWGDYDGDGDPDLFLTNAGPDQLYRNNGDGTFTDVTAQAGVAGGATQLSTSGLWFDADGDGDLDLHVGVWEDYAPAGLPRRLANRLHRNNGDGTFTDIATDAGLGDTGKTYMTLPLDANGDGAPDLYNANDFGANRLFVNDGAGRFTEQTTAYGLDDAGEGMGLALGDPTGDGRADLYLTNRADAPEQSNPLFVGLPGGGFADRSAEAGVGETGWSWGAAFLDLENDGDEDLFVANGYVAADTRNALFVNDGAFPYVERAADWAVDALDAARGVAVFDADFDGRLDLLVANVSRAPHLYGNRSAAGRWLAVALDGQAPNTDALGAVVEVEAGGRTYTRWHHGAQFLGQNLTTVHVGLGAATAVTRVTVRWPGGGTDEATGLQPDQRIRIRQGVGLVEGLPVDASPRPDRAAPRLAAFPNPTAGSVRFRVDGGAPGLSRLCIADVLGRLVRCLDVGSEGVVWDGRDALGQRVVPGVYRVVGAGGATRVTIL
jgi:hypothetical protein